METTIPAAFNIIYTCCCIPCNLEITRNFKCVRVIHRFIVIVVWYYFFFFFGIRETGMIKTLVFIIQTREKILWIFLLRRSWIEANIAYWPLLNEETRDVSLFGRLECVFSCLSPIFHFFSKFLFFVCVILVFKLLTKKQWLDVFNVNDTFDKLMRLCVRCFY